MNKDKSTKVKQTVDELIDKDFYYKNKRSSTRLTWSGRGPRNKDRA